MLTSNRLALALLLCFIVISNETCIPSPLFAPNEVCNFLAYFFFLRVLWRRLLTLLSLVPLLLWSQKNIKGNLRLFKRKVFLCLSYWAGLENCPIVLNGMFGWIVGTEEEEDDICLTAYGIQFWIMNSLGFRMCRTGFVF